MPPKKKKNQDQGSKKADAKKKAQVRVFDDNEGDERIRRNAFFPTEDER